MNISKYINIILLKLSEKYNISLLEIKTYKNCKKYKTIKLTIYNYSENKNKIIEVKTERELLLRLKEMM